MGRTKNTGGKAGRVRRRKRRRRGAPRASKGSLFPTAPESPPLIPNAWHVRAYAHAHIHTQCTETTRRHRVMVHNHTSSLPLPPSHDSPCSTFKLTPPSPPFPTSLSLSSVGARWHVHVPHAPASADSSAGCGECASPRGPYLSYATPCKSATITEQRRRRNSPPPDGARSALASLCFPRRPLAPVPAVIKGQQALFTKCAGHYRTRRRFTSWEDENAVFSLSFPFFFQPLALIASGEHFRNSGSVTRLTLHRRITAAASRSV